MYGNSTYERKSIDCTSVPNYTVCEVLVTLSDIMHSYLPLLRDLIDGLLQWPNLLIVTFGACILLQIVNEMVCKILTIIIG